MNTKFTKALGLLVFILPVICQATTIKIGFAGVVDQVDDPCNLLDNGVADSASISGFYTYDSETSDSTPELAYNGLYEYSTTPYGMSMTIGETTFQTNTADVDFMLNIWNDFDGIPKDRYRVTSYSNLSVEDLHINRLSWFLDDYSGNALSSKELPDTLPVLSVWQSNLLLIDGYSNIEPSKYFEFYGHITDVWLVPEPATMLLFGLGGLFLRRRS
jgi:hypothetical protein